MRQTSSDPSIGRLVSEQKSLAPPASFLMDFWRVFIVLPRRDIEKLLQVMLPILVAQVATGAVTFINTTMTGHAGANDLAGVSVGAGLFYPVLSAIIGLLMAGTPIMAQLLGHKERNRLPEVVRAGLLIGLVISSLFTLGYVFFIDTLLDTLNLEAEVAHVARYYLMAMVGVVFFVSMIIPLRCLVDIAGSTSCSMKLFMAAPFLNGAFNYVFIYGNLGMPALGGIGAGISMMMTYAVLLVLFASFVWNVKDLMGKEIISSLSIHAKDLKEYLLVGVPSGLSIFMELFLFSLIIVFLAPYGTDTLAAFQIADNFANMVFTIPVSCAMALTILVATAVGSGDMEMAKRYRKAGFIVALTFASITASSTILFRNIIGSVYTNDEAVILIASQFLIYSAGWQMFDAISTPVQGILRGLKDTRVSFVLMVMAYWGGCVPMSLFLEKVVGLGAASYWFGLTFGVALSALFMICRLTYVERAVSGKPVFTFASLITLFKEGRLVPVVVSFGNELSCRALREDIRKAKAYLHVLSEMEEKLSSLIQSTKEKEVDIFTETLSVLPIRLGLLTEIHLSVVGHASRAYVP